MKAFGLIISIFLAGILSCSSGELSSSGSSAEEVAKMVLAAVRNNDAKTLDELRISRGEFKKIMWPELPARKHNMPFDFAWGNLEKKCYKGIKKQLAQFGGQEFDFERVYFKGGEEDYPSFKIHSNSVLVVKDREGRLRELEILGSIVERNGEFKLLSYDD